MVVKCEQSLCIMYYYVLSICIMYFVQIFSSAMKPRLVVPANVAFKLSLAQSQVAMRLIGLLDNINFNLKVFYLISEIHVQ